MGLINKSNINAYWNTKDWSQSTPAFKAVFIRDRFLMLHSMLHFPEKEGGTGRLKKVQNLVQNFSEQFWNYYVPKKNVSIDESFIGHTFFDSNVLEIWPNESASDSLKIDVTKKIISQELKHISPNGKKH